MTLFEKGKLGGQFIFAPLPSGKPSLQRQLDYFIGELKDSRIKLEMKEVRAEDLIGKYGGAIIATGSESVVPAIDGLKEYRWAEILDDFNLPTNKNVVIIGGGLIGVEIANTLSDYGHRVTIIEMLYDIARDMEMVTRVLNLDKLKKSNVSVFTNSKVTKIDGSTIFFLKTNGTEKQYKLEGIDIYVVAAGMRPKDELAKELQGKMPCFPVGDADKAGDAVSAVQSGYFAAREL